MRVIGGTDKDSIINNSPPAKIKYYDTKDNIIVGPLRSRLKNDTTINRYDYNAFKYNSGNTIKGVTYANQRGVYLHAGYTYTKQKFRKDPFAWQQTFAANYSPGNKSWGADYSAIFNQVIGKWSLVLNGSIDQQLKNYFWGIGNETIYDQGIKYYDLHTNEAIGNIGLNRSFGRFNNLTVSGFYQNIKVKDETDKYSFNLLPSDPTIYDRKNFAGAQILYDFHHLDDVQLPTRGFALLAMASQTENLTDHESFQRYTGEMGFYAPFSKKVSIGIRAGGATLSGDIPEFYQLNWLGGRQNLRGYHRQRFYGKTTFYNNNELRWITNIKGRMYSGRFGIVGFFDEGRVWQPGEASNIWHTGYGGGIVLSPFNRLTLTILYGISKEDQLIHLKFGLL
jgi:hemolysin activation/secretion protein